MASLYRKILNQSVKIAWKKKYLWFFGLFAIILTGNDADFEILNRFFTDSSQSIFSPLQSIVDSGLLTSRGLGNMFKLFQADPISLLSGVLILVIIVLLILFVVWLMIVSQSALVKNTANIIASKENNIQTGVESGIKNFWAVLGLNILNKIAVAIAAFLIAFPVTTSLFNSHPIVSVLSYLVMFLVLIPVALSISLLLKYAIAYRVIKGEDFIGSIKKGFSLFTNNWLVSLEMAVTLFLINFLASIIIIIVLLMLIWPFFLLSYAVAAVSTALLLFVQMLAIATLFGFVAASGSFLAVFQISSWTGLFIELINKGGTSKITRVIEKVFK